MISSSSAKPSLPPTDVSPIDDVVTKWERKESSPASTPPPPNALPPKATFGAVLKASQMKANMKTDTLFVLGIAAGALIGFGALLMNNVGGSSPALMAANPGACNFLKGAVGLPTGLFMVVITGSLQR